MVNRYELVLNDADMDTLQEALIKLPYERVAPLIGKIQAQLQEAALQEQSRARAAEEAAQKRATPASPVKKPAPRARGAK